MLMSLSLAGLRLLLPTCPSSTEVVSIEAQDASTTPDAFALIVGAGGIEVLTSQRIANLEDYAGIERFRLRGLSDSDTHEVVCDAVVPGGVRSNTALGVRRADDQAIVMVISDSSPTFF